MVVKSWLWLVLGIAMSAGSATGQGPVQPIDDDALERRIEQACEALRIAGRLRHADEFATAAAANPGPAPRPPLPLRTERLAAEDLHDLLVPSLRTVGHYYLCTECDQWHFSGASGFCVDADGAVATCAHVLATDATMREAYLVVADLTGHVEPALGVLTADFAADVCILQTAAQHTVPLPLRLEARVGERLYCLANPDHRFGFFSEGMLARWYAERDEGAGADAAPRTWLHVTCEIAQGSSGGMVVDARGNLVGIAQSTTTVVDGEEDGVEDTQMVFRSAVPAAALRRLLPPAPAPPPASGAAGTPDPK